MNIKTLTVTLLLVIISCCNTALSDDTVPDPEDLYPPIFRSSFKLIFVPEEMIERDKSYVQAVVFTKNMDKKMCSSFKLVANCMGGNTRIRILERDDFNYKKIKNGRLKITRVNHVDDSGFFTPESLRRQMSENGYVGQASGAFETFQTITKFLCPGY